MGYNTKIPNLLHKAVKIGLYELSSTKNKENMLEQNLNKEARQNQETGLSSNTDLSNSRIFNKNGEANIQTKGSARWGRLNIYHSLLSMSNWKFLATILLFFIGINLFFASIYLLIGLDHLSGMEAAVTNGEKFGEAFFFSAQTFTTVGYGRINPVGFSASLTASLEALVGLMSFALATGLLYGRFARPRAYIKYSNNAVFAPFKDGMALMFRMVPYTKNYLVNVEVKITLVLRMEEEGQWKNKFYDLPLEVSKANTMTANWTIVHVINELSPLHQFKKADIAAAKAELLVFVQGFDESFSNTVISRTSYFFEEFIYGAKFVPMFHPNASNTRTVLYIDRLNDFVTAELPFQFN
ncbi:MAG: Inward rectifier potassium channel Irk [Sphingobacteriia bacterium]|nr:MAG: Inward rectifier potassium channel Irk [Sphingobacteriia bacterium]TAG32266.1 MAG: Inward rectifier potassium channel Irk [Sphingobacteriia bacterium]